MFIMNKNQKNKGTVVAILSVVSASIFPWIVLYFNNIGSITITEAYKSLLVLIGFGILLLLLTWAITRSVTKAAIISSISVFSLSNFSLIEKGFLKIFPSLYYWHVLIIVVFLLITIGFLIKIYLAEDLAHKLVQGILTIFSLLLIVNILMAMPDIFKVLRQEKMFAAEREVAAPSDAPPENVQTRPNVYYFIFDEYGGSENLKRYTGFENFEFIQYLEAFGFVVSPDSRNKTTDTFTEIPNLLQLAEVNTIEMPANAKKEAAKDPLLLIAMAQLGYEINVLQPPSAPFIDENYADYLYVTDKGTSFRTFDYYIYEKTAYYPFYGKTDQDNEIQLMEEMFTYAEESVNLSSSNLFTIGYFYFPHYPYIVDENGNKTSSVIRTDLKNPDAYLAQLKYTNKKISHLVATIRNNQPEAVIVLQSDHGLRLPLHMHYFYGIKSYDLEVEDEYVRNILNAVYYNGEQLEISGMEGITTLKLVIDRLSAP